MSFHTVEAATEVRKILDGENIMGYRVRVYFGESTPIEPVDQHLQAPESKKLFFISPPPSPPLGWITRNEEAPNKQVHAEDLAAALGKLHPSNHDEAAPRSPASPGNPKIEELKGSSRGATRTRSGSLIVYRPEDHGDSPNLPAIEVEDLTGEESLDTDADADADANISSIESGGKVVTHMARPPVELMNEA